MMSLKDWVLSQLISKSVASSRPLLASDSFLSEEHPDQEFDHPAHTADLVTTTALANTTQSSNDNQQNTNHFHSQQRMVEDSFQSDFSVNEKPSPVVKIEALQIKFLRLLKRFGLSEDNLLVSKVLYRIQLASLIRARESDLKRANLKIERARVIAAEQEAAGRPQLDFSFKILVLGRTGVGKSSTINSIFDQSRATTNAFKPATDRIQEIAGTVNGIRVSFIDTPGLLPPSPSNVRKNKKILRSVKRFLRKSKPDMVLYFERLDLINTGYSDFPLLKLITEVFGPAIWFNTIIVMTHSSFNLPEGINGYPVNYESFITTCTDLVQHYIHQAVSDTKLENPVVLVENDPNCKTNNAGEKILPNGQAWKSQLLLLCICTKVLSDVNTLLDFEDSLKVGPSNVGRLPSLPHLLSSFLKHRAQIRHGGSENEIDEVPLLDSDDEDEYYQLPPIRILTKSQFERLSGSQKKDYLDELDYREILYLKKQLIEEARRRREKRVSSSESKAPNDESDNQEEGSPEPVLLPDMAIPPSFDSDCPVHRYRCLVTSEQWLARPVLDTNGWDHDVSFDGINLESSAEIRKNIIASVNGQMSKDKRDFSIQSEFAAAFTNPGGPTYAVGLDIQSANKELICTIHSSAKVRNLRNNVTECGISVIPFGDKYFLGTKCEDSFSIGKRLKFTVNAGRMGGAGQAAYGGSFGATLRGKDYPVRNESLSLSMTVLSLNKDTVLSGNLQTDFRVSRGTNMSVSANLNNRKMGQVSIKTSSSEHMEVAFIALFSIVRALFRRKRTDQLVGDSLEAE
ncbi:PREDICTED: translocase of chloroplast 90, chloroplastic [Nicotiana attenuata]|uniref:Translocase of chloroplast 90, chloroplastic n=1 Tax=Nicotiana attenuata TaxID=49451 RepID=A0A1J6I9A3_NICAT|nr:PREDICTED: translocase of chloroplast 90, chloroplastic [Nicotiana attenuata]OIS97111.1 translocase of chloroplast 90, chloroplastic [Nicotiana attenuata]